MKYTNTYTHTHKEKQTQNFMNFTTLSFYLKKKEKEALTARLDSVGLFCIFFFFPTQLFVLKYAEQLM